MARLDRTPFEAEITDLTHDGRGVARSADGKTPGESGKAIFISGALPGERVIAIRTGRHRSFDEARTVEVLQAAPERVEPRCVHFGTCGGCALQHYAEDRQILAKQRVLRENLERIGKVAPERWLEPLTDAAWGYRRKGRLSVRRVEKKDKTLVGFRETDPRFVADLSECHTVIPQIGQKLGALSALVDGLEARREIPQIEFIAGDEAVALTFRHLKPLSEGDRAALTAFAKENGFAIYLQPGGIDSVHPLALNGDGRDEVPLSFRLPGWDVELKFRPLDFIQVNAGLNHKMIRHAFDLLEPQPDERVLDLFAGLGNFTLPLARQVREVVGVEGETGLVQRARDNAAHNGLDNARFFAADLAKDLSGEPWMREGFDKLLLDPPRSGADFVLSVLPLKQFKRIVYVSCHPASLARDAGYLVNEKGWKLKAAGVMDMFPHTAHVESIALFEP
ncbi:23S rRNA (uracil(1939)-C(5))-methyltransferase RlmD [Marilutibacter alkalisoli]|uniref:23S rRNA (uracil(1939)-C(5))-methyltransferase RlmD n=1 Tax=Marilutibacter alkalisoli TaxID=2591633 RepID=A0A514BT12_9GAMM|nr:23S rRNA (uracil(1939)-C(5))-methyltransferase RlmD [Lysobacter alkalisoli]QDH70497.1 23S rRNA (uracil(1939)-C(5))-methyltransferase RlmD [Lysobacter alkalisoli]